MKAHGIMFHHFHGKEGRHPAGQGSISADDFRDILTWLRQTYRILNASDFYGAALRGELKNEDICLTFDDSLLCQYEIAVPILKEEGLTAFFFVYSSAFTNEPDMLEIYRFFRSTKYPDFDSFCDDFMALVHSEYDDIVTAALKHFDPDHYLTDFPFYTENDKWFRYVRDHALTKEQYSKIMAGLMDMRNFKLSEALPRLFMDSSHLMDLHNQGNVVGLHSHTHPTNMDAIASADQRAEYTANHAFLCGVVGEEPKSMSHPCGRYNADTLRILTNLGVQIGFRSSLSIPEAPSLLEIPREDHTNILSRMQT